MAVLTAIEQTDLEAALHGWKVGALERFTGVERGTVNSSFSVWAGGARWFFRLYEEQDLEGARAEARLLAHLRANGAKTPAPVPRKDGALIGIMQDKPCALFPFVPGDMRCQSAVTADDAHALGRELAKLHAAADGAEPRANRFGVEELRARLDRIEKDATEELRVHVPFLRDRLVHHHGARAHAPLLVVHGDVFRDNVLFDGAEIACVLDFESAGLETVTYDLAVAMLAFTYRASFDWDAARALVTGYESERRLAASERETLFSDACFGAVRFTITRITDCAMRGGKKDYRRFMARLAELEAKGAEAFRASVGL